MKQDKARNSIIRIGIVIKSSEDIRSKNSLSCCSVGSTETGSSFAPISTIITGTRNIATEVKRLFSTPSLTVIGMIRLM